MALLLQALRAVRTLHGDVEMLPPVVGCDPLDVSHITPDFCELECLLARALQTVALCPQALDDSRSLERSSQLPYIHRDNRGAGSQHPMCLRQDVLG